MPYKLPAGFEYEDKLPPGFEYEDEPPQAGVGGGLLSQQGQEDIPLSEVPGRALSNIPKSAFEFGKNIVQPFLHPIKTMEGISKVGSGALGLTEDTEAWESVKSFFKERYGSVEGLKKTISDDPVGFMADISTVLTAGGAAAARAPGMVGRIGAGVRTAGELANPLTAAGKTVGAVTRPVSDWLSTRITESVFKLPVKAKIGKREAIVDTIQEFGIQPSKSGWMKVKEGITSRNEKATALIQDASKTGSVPVTDVVSVLDDVAASFKNIDLPKSAEKVIAKYKKQILKEGKTQYTIQELNEFKKRLDSDLKPMYVQQIKINPGFKTSIIQDAKKALADRIRDIMYEKVPGLETLNREQSKLLRIEPFVQEAANRIHNWSAVTLYDYLLAGGAIMYKAPVEALAAATAWRIIRSPHMQQLAARGLLKGFPVSAKTAGKIAVGARATDLLSPRQ